MPERKPIAHVHDEFGNDLFVEDVGERRLDGRPTISASIQMRSPLAAGRVVDLDPEAARRVGEALIQWAERAR